MALPTGCHKDPTTTGTSNPGINEDPPGKSLRSVKPWLAARGEDSAPEWRATLSAMTTQTRPAHGTERSPGHSHWKDRLAAFMEGLSHMLWLIVIYLLSEMIIWGLSRALAPLEVQFFASIVGMMVLFILMTGTYLLSRWADKWYHVHVKAKVDFINSHLGIGFPIPLVTLDDSQMLAISEIGRIMGNFLITNLISWASCFALSYFAILGSYSLRRPLLERQDSIAISPPVTGTAPRLDMNWQWDTTSTERNEEDEKKSEPSPRHSPHLSQRSSVECESKERLNCLAVWAKFAAIHPLLVPFSLAIVIGMPIAATTHDMRALDGFMLWFVWVLTVKTQRWFKGSSLCRQHPRVKGALATMLNPVLMTTLITTAYTRIRSAVYGSDLPRVLLEFCRGTPLYAIWTSLTTGVALPSNPDHYFGAGDLALSVLECGILIWGFKLYECRHQLFSLSGLLTVLISIAAAAGNVFLCVLCGHAMGLDMPEALAFAARSTTLALAKPAIQAVEGNTVVNAALVVSNGILGQLLYPFVLTKINVQKTSEQAEDRAVAATTSQSDGSQASAENEEDEAKRYDSPTTIAAGIAVGINGAAMGVAYLYETKSRAAPYAALAMTVFGIMTVVFTTVDPFKSIVIGLASF